MMVEEQETWKARLWGWTIYGVLFWLALALLYGVMSVVFEEIKYTSKLWQIAVWEGFGGVFASLITVALIGAPALFAAGFLLGRNFQWLKGMEDTRGPHR